MEYDQLYVRVSHISKDDTTERSSRLDKDEEFDGRIKVKGWDGKGTGTGRIERKRGAERRGKK